MHFTVIIFTYLENSPNSVTETLKSMLSLKLFPKETSETGSEKFHTDDEAIQMSIYNLLLDTAHFLNSYVQEKTRTRRKTISMDFFGGGRVWGWTIVFFFEGEGKGGAIFGA